MDPIQLPHGAACILDALREHGEKAYLVGGCVRDSLMGLCPHDWDICTSALPQTVRDGIFAGVPCYDTGIRHGTVTLVLPDGMYEVTTFRAESGYSDGRRPDAVRFVADLETDLSRRDFTINAMAYHPREGLIDPFHGREDIARGRIRCVGDPDERFSEDALRILRAIRFSARYNYRLEPETRQAMLRHRNRLSAVSAERTGSELRQILCAPYAAQALDAAQPVLSEGILPELAPLIGCAQNNRYHRYPVYEHTLAALQSAATAAVFPGEWADDAVRIALFFHDFGKPATKTTGADGYDHFYGHAAVSAQIAGQVLDRLRFGKREIRTVTQLIASHGVDFSPTRPCVRRLLNRFGPDQLRRLLKLRECDNAAQSALAARRFYETAVPFAGLLEEVLAEPPAFSRKDLAIDGRDVLSYPIRPGPAVGRILDHLLRLVLEGTLENDRETLLGELDRIARAFQDGQAVQNERAFQDGREDFPRTKN